MFRLQIKHPETDCCYPIPKEVGDLYDAPSDGGSQWIYSGFRQYYFEETHPRWPWVTGEIPGREETWKKWITKWVGK
jgi:hypothetical protein